MSVVDDFGRCDARTEILRSKMYPLKLGVVSSSDIVKWMEECSNTGLIRQYTISGREYLEILNFNQTVRIKKSKVPPPPNEDDMQMQADVKQTQSTCVPETKRNESGVGDGEHTREKVPRGWSSDEYYDSGQQMFDEVKADELFVERLLRIVHGSGFLACKEVQVLKAARFFITRESAKPEFKYRPRSEHKSYLVNWITKNATTLNQYDK
jgi:hypothetical protein